MCQRTSLTPAPSPTPKSSLTRAPGVVCEFPCGLPNHVAISTTETEPGQARQGPALFPLFTAVLTCRPLRTSESCTPRDAVVPGDFRLNSPLVKSLAHEPAGRGRYDSMFGFGICVFEGKRPLR